MGTDNLFHKKRERRESEYRRVVQKAVIDAKSGELLIVYIGYN